MSEVEKTILEAMKNYVQDRQPEEEVLRVAYWHEPEGYSDCCHPHENGRDRVIIAYHVSTEWGEDTRYFSYYGSLTDLIQAMILEEDEH